MLRVLGFNSTCKDKRNSRNHTGNINHSYFLKFRARETCVSWFSPSAYYEVADEKGNVEFVVQGPGGCVFECRRPNAFRVRDYK